jgi:hypothetical protein
MHTETYSSPIIKPAGAIVDLTAAAHIDHYSPEPGTTVMPGAIFSRSPDNNRRHAAAQPGADNDISAGTDAAE